MWSASIRRCSIPLRSGLGESMARRDRFVSLDRPAFSSGGKLLSHLQWKTLLRLLAIAEVSEIRSFVYDPSLQPMTDLNGSALTIVLNTTLQLQITWRSYQQALPLALKKPHHFTRVGNDDWFALVVLQRSSAHNLRGEGDDHRRHAMRPDQPGLRRRRFCLDTRCPLSLRHQQDVTLWTRSEM